MYGGGSYGSFSYGSKVYEITFADWPFVITITDGPEFNILISDAIEYDITLFDSIEYNTIISQDLEYDITITDNTEFNIKITQVGDNINTYQVGESPKFEAETRNVDNNLADPASVLIYIRDPDDTLSVDGIAMTKTETGKYYYDYTIDSKVGTYYVKVKAIGSGARVSIQPDNFKAVESFGV